MHPRRLSGSMALPAGTRLGPYEIVSFLRTEACAEVYRAATRGWTARGLICWPPSRLREQARMRCVLQPATVALEERIAYPLTI